MSDDRAFMVPTYGALADEVSRLEAQLEVKAALLAGMAVELAATRFELEQALAWKAEALAFYEPGEEDGQTPIERKVLAAQVGAHEAHEPLGPV